jgi:energy-coupling factor transport system substrate-specific component
VVELFTMWRSTRMVVLTAVSAALYASILIPFKVVPLIPGVTELRPRARCRRLLVPVRSGGRLGRRVRQRIGELFGGLGPGDLFGFLGNLASASSRMRCGTRVPMRPPTRARRRNVAALIAVIAVASVCARRSSAGDSTCLGFHLFT